MHFKMEGSKVYRCRFILSCNGKSAHQEGDVVLIQGMPHAVLEWEQINHGEFPAVVVPLDPGYLHPLWGWKGVDCMYELPVEDPRSLN
jgi:hypothetical protein